MLTELCADSRQLTRFLRSAHQVRDEHKDVAATSLIERIDQKE
jgi:hypothetical protein